MHLSCSEIIDNSILDLPHDLFPTLDFVLRYFVFLLMLLLGRVDAVMDALVLEHDVHGLLL